MRLPTLSPKTHIAVGQTFLVMTLVLAALLLELVPDENAGVRKGRAALAEAIAITGSALMSEGDLQKLDASLRPIVERNPELLSAAVRRGSGHALVTVGDHEAQWDRSLGEKSTENQLIVPIWSQNQRWGQVELRFRALQQPGWRGFVQNPRFKLVGFMVLGSLFVFYFYLGKMLQHLNPSQSVPAHVRSALDTLAEGLMVLDLKGQIVLANTAFAATLDSDPETLLGRKASELDWVNAEGAPFEAVESPWAKAIADGQLRTNDLLQLRADDGELRTFLVNCSPVLGSGGRFAGVLVSLDDVTLLEESKTELAAAKDDAESANRAKSEFLANMSHEIRTPMNAILGYAEVLKRGFGKREDSKKYLNTITSSGEHLLQLINDVLDLSKVEAGRLEVERIPLAPHVLIREVMNVLSGKAEEKNLSLVFEVDGAIPETIQSDPTRLRQILTNLLSNAIKFTEQGGVKVVARLTPDAQLSIDVVDSGIGMSEDALDSIFEAFVQADTSVTRRFGGTGLGLPISRRFARLLGGDIVVASTPKGSTFTVTLDPGPLDDSVKRLTSEQALAAVQKTADAGSGYWEFPPARVLVVDDGEENRDLARVVLEEVGLQVDSAENGQVGVDKALRGEFDVVLMDMQMPVMDGYTAVATLRKQGYTTPVFALTASAMKGSEQKCIDAGCTGYIAKPIDIDFLIGTLAELLGGSRKTGPKSAPAPEADRSAPAPLGTPLVSPLVSRLAENPKMVPIIAKFLPRLGKKLAAMQVSWEARDWTELASLAHWLKGSAGTVGFDDFKEPAAALEQLAKAGRDDGVEPLLAQLHGLAARIEGVGDTGASKLASAPSSTDSPVRKAGANAPLLSRLAGNAKFEPIIQKFIPRLQQKVEAMEVSWEARNYEELASLAHWLKGSAATVGFDDFKEPAATLEGLAKEQKASEIDAALNELRALADRVRLP